VRPLVSAILLLVVMASHARAQPAGPPEIGVRAFIEMVDQISREIDDVDPGRLGDVLIPIPERLRVRAGDQHFDVSLVPLARMVADAARDPSRWPERRGSIQRRLLTIRSEAASLADGSPAPAGPAADATLGAILARKEFATTAGSDWMARLRARVRDWLRALWSRAGGDRLDTERASRMLVWLSTLAAAAGVLLWLYRNVRRRGRAGPGALPEEAATAARQWALDALAAAGEGRASEAVRLAYRAAVVRLAELGVWRIDEARTAREYTTLLPGVGARDGAFRGIAAQLERVVYANRAASPDDLARLHDHLEALGCVRPHERAI
jgi:Domain of unknown function (DUF4129)